MPSLTLGADFVLVKESSSITGIVVEDDSMFVEIEEAGTGVSGFAAADIVLIDPSTAKARFKDTGVIYYVLHKDDLYFKEVALP